MTQEQTTKPEARTYPYEHLMMDEYNGGMICIFKNPDYHPNEHYLGRGTYRSWQMESYGHEAFAKMILFGQIEVVDVPQQIWVHEMDKMQDWQKIERLVNRFQEKGFTVDKCPHCDSENVEYDGDGWADGCEADWASWQSWSVQCLDCDDFKHSGKYVTSSGGRW